MGASYDPGNNFSPRRSAKAPAFLEPAKVSAGVGERSLDKVIAEGLLLLLVHPKAVQASLDNFTAFHTAYWYEGPDYDTRVIRQAIGRPYWVGQTQPVGLIYPTTPTRFRRRGSTSRPGRFTSSLQVDGPSLDGTLEAAGAFP